MQERFQGAKFSMPEQQRPDLFPFNPRGFLESYWPLGEFTARTSQYELIKESQIVKPALSGTQPGTLLVPNRCKPSKGCKPKAWQGNSAGVLSCGHPTSSDTRAKVASGPRSAAVQGSTTQGEQTGPAVIRHLCPFPSTRSITD